MARALQKGDMKPILLTWFCFIPIAPNFAWGGMQKSVTFTLNDKCYEVQFEQGSSTVLSCQYPLDIEYKMRECSSGKLIEHGTNVAELTCPNDLEWKMRFRNTSNIVALVLRVKRESVGKKGVTSSYLVQSSQLE